MNLRRVAAVAALVTAALFLLSIILTFAAGTPPALDDSARKVAAYYEDNQGLLQLNAVITYVSIGLIALWFVPIYRWIRDRAWVAGDAGTAARPAAGDESGTWATIALTGFIATGAVAAAQTGVGGALAQSIEDTRGSDEVVTALFDTFNGLGSAIGPLFALFLAALAMSSRGSGYLPGWTSPVLLVAAGASLISMLAPITESDAVALVGLFAFLLFIVVLAASGLTLLRSAAGETTRTTTAAP